MSDNSLAFIQNSDDWTWRYIAIFSSRAVADEWWRALSTCKSAKLRDSVRRIGPQFYTHAPLLANVATSLSDKDGTPEFMDKMSFNLLRNTEERLSTFSIIPTDTSRDRISGQT